MKTIFFVFSILFASVVSAQVELKICTDKSTWYPYSYEKNGVSQGLHIDIVKFACGKLNWSCSFTPLPWKRCLKETYQGNYDAIVSAAYQDERAKYLYYPDNAKNALKSEWRITQVDYIVVTHPDLNYKFTGNLNTLPKPIRAPLGYSIVDDLRENGIEVFTDQKVENNFIKVIKAKRGSIISPPETARLLIEKHNLQTTTVIHDEAIASKSYFVPFSKRSKISQTQRLDMWNTIIAIRENQEVYNEISSSY